MCSALQNPLQRGWGGGGDGDGGGGGGGCGGDARGAGEFFGRWAGALVGGWADRLVGGGRVAKAMGKKQEKLHALALSRTEWAP